MRVRSRVRDLHPGDRFRRLRGVVAEVVEVRQRAGLPGSQREVVWRPTDDPSMTYATVWNASTTITVDRPDPRSFSHSFHPQQRVGPTDTRMALCGQFIQGSDAVSEPTCPICARELERYANLDI
jgi:hypothetical protein